MYAYTFVSLIGRHREEKVVTLRIKWLLLLCNYLHLYTWFNYGLLFSQINYVCVYFVSGTFIHLMR
jgi:hypothetical protein